MKIPAWFVPALLAATASAAEPLTPESAVALALEHHPSLRAAAGEVDAARADLSLARTGWIPRIELQEDLARSTNPVFVFAGKLGQESFGPADFAIESLNRPDPLTNAATRVALRQNLFDADRSRLGRHAADAGVEAAERMRSRSADAVAFEATRAFWDAVLAGRALAAAVEGEKAAIENARLATARAEEGLTVPSDRLQAEVRLAEVRALKLRAEGAVASARAALRYALGVAEDRDFELMPPPVDPDDAPAPADPSQRADLLALDARLRQAEAGETMARRGWWPVIGLGAQYEWNADTPFASDGSNWTVALSARLPIFDGLETRARAARARADRDRLQAIRSQAAEGALLETRAAEAARSAASGRLIAARGAVGLAEEALRIVKDRYAEGLAVMVELLGAEAARTASLAELASAEHDLALARAAHDFAAGRPLAPEEAR
ncbi:MAG TPA: TolC family protein [Candidatus Polarisedimenticolaceae bacterium]